MIVTRHSGAMNTAIEVCVSVASTPRPRPPPRGETLSTRGRDLGRSSENSATAGGDRPRRARLSGGGGVLCFEMTAERVITDSGDGRATCDVTSERRTRRVFLATPRRHRVGSAGGSEQGRPCNHFRLGATSV